MTESKEEEKKVNLIKKNALFMRIMRREWNQQDCFFVLLWLKWCHPLEMWMNNDECIAVNIYKNHTLSLWNNVQHNT